MQPLGIKDGGRGGHDHLSMCAGCSGETARAPQGGGSKFAEILKRGEVADEPSQLPEISGGSRSRLICRTRGWRKAYGLVVFKSLNS